MKGSVPQTFGPWVISDLELVLDSLKRLCYQTASWQPGGTSNSFFAGALPPTGLWCFPGPIVGWGGDISSSDSIYPCCYLYIIFGAFVSLMPDCCYLTIDFVHAAAAAKTERRLGVWCTLYKLWHIFFWLHGIVVERWSLSCSRPTAGRHFLRSATYGDLLVPRTSTSTYGPHSFAVSGPCVWNKLPATLRVSPTIGQFQSKLKAVLFRSAYETWLGALVTA